MAGPCSAIGRRDSPLHMHREGLMDDGNKALVIIYREAENLFAKGLKACSRTFCDHTDVRTPTL